MELLHAFGLDIRIFIAQMINFAVLVFLLYRFAYQPVLTLLRERQEKIKKGIEDAKNAALALAGANEKREEILTQSREEAKEILGKAAAAGERERERAAKEAEEKAKEILALAQKRAEEEKMRAVAEARREMGALALAAAEKILREKMTPEREREYIARVV